MLVMKILFILLVNVVLHVRIANQVVMDSRCREGIVNIPGGCSRALVVQRRRPTALWPFRVKTSDSPSDLSRLHRHNKRAIRVCHIYAQQGIRVYGDDRCQLLMRQ